MGDDKRSQTEAYPVWNLLLDICFFNEVRLSWILMLFVCFLCGVAFDAARDEAAGKAALAA